MEIELSANGDSIKLSWRASSGGSKARPILLPKNRLLTRAAKVREDLNELNAYVAATQLDMSRDPSWARYSEILVHLREDGKALYSAMFPYNEPGSRALLAVLDAMPQGDEIQIHCSDDQVTLPLGFLYHTDVMAPVISAGVSPSRRDFAGFWLLRYSVTMLIAGSQCETFEIDPASFRSLYALHRRDLEDAYDYLGPDRVRLELMLSTIDCREGFYDWPHAERACDEIARWNSVVFVFAHSDGDFLRLESTSIDSLQFAEMLQRNHGSEQTSLILLNCCFSVAGSENCSLLGSAAKDGFCGLIGTEAEILNTHAIRCGIRIMWGLCAEGLTLGEAFTQMQHADDLFPLNLLYTCYADRRFRLARPFDHLKAA